MTETKFVHMSEIEKRLEKLVSQALLALGFEIVRLSYDSGILQIMAERLDGERLSVSDCGAISRAVSAILEVDDPISGAYSLEVSSPGIDRPLTRLKDFEQYEGYEAKIRTIDAIDGRKNFRGTLGKLTSEAVYLALEGEEELSIPLQNILKAKLVLTDDLIKSASMEQQ